MNLNDAITEISHANKRLADEQGRLARKNARTAVKAAISTALRAMDREFPLIRKERIVSVSMSPLAKKRRERARTLGFIVVSADEAVTFTTAGVKIRMIRNDAGAVKQYQAHEWAVRALRAGVAKTEIARAVHSTAVRKRIEALVRLRQAPTLKPIVP